MVRFEDTDELKGAEFVNVDLSGACFRNVNLEGAKVMEAVLVNARISGLIDGLVVNDVEVAPLIRAEMARRYPERTKLTPRDAAGVRDAWSVIVGLWAATKQRAGALPESTLRARVDGEWSFLETLRHLVFVTDSWISATVLGRTGHHHPFGMPPTFVTNPESFGIDVAADPPFTAVVAAREDRMEIVAALVADITDDELRRPCGEHTMLFCLWTLLDEEWYHNWFANRDLDVLTHR